MIYVGIACVILAIALLVKRFETRMVLIGVGILMCCIAGTPMKALDAFSKGMTNGMITSACSSMGFAMAMRYTGCDKHLINLLAKVLLKVQWALIPGVIFGTYAVNIALPSAAGTSAAAGAIFIPILMGAGVHPAMAAAAVKAGTYGSMLNPGLAHNVMVAKIAHVDVMEVIAYHSMANFASVIVAAIVLTGFAYYLKEQKGHFVEGLEIEQNFKINYLYALMPVVPIVILLLGSTKIVPIFKMGVAQAMIIGTILGMLVTRCRAAEDQDSTAGIRENAGKMTKSFFKGMGDSYADIMGIIMAAAVFVAGMNALGLVKAFIGVMTNNPAIVKIMAGLGPMLLGFITGTGDGATFAFNGAVTPHAAQFGMTAVQLGSMATLGGTLGRTISPIAGATIIVAGIAGVNPVEVAKRNFLPIGCAFVVGMLVLSL